MKRNLDVLGFIGILATFVSILISFKLSIEIIVLTIGLFLSFIATYIYLALKDSIREHDREIRKINEVL